MRARICCAGGGAEQVARQRTHPPVPVLCPRRNFHKHFTRHISQALHATQFVTRRCQTEHTLAVSAHAHQVIRCAHGRTTRPRARPCSSDSPTLRHAPPHSRASTIPRARLQLQSARVVAACSVTAHPCDYRDRPSTRSLHTRASLWIFYAPILPFLPRFRAIVATRLHTHTRVRRRRTRQNGETKAFLPT